MPSSDRARLFSTVLSSPACHAAHSGSLEAVAVGLALRWVLRSSGRHSKRTLLLVDARAVIGAAAKRRSSAPTIRRDIMRIAALTLAGDLHVHLAYIPSEENPADAPSRGFVRRWRRHARAQPWKGKEPAATPLLRERSLRCKSKIAKR